MAAFEVMAPSSGGSILPATIGAPRQQDTQPTASAVTTTAATQGWLEIQATVDASVVFHVWQQEVTAEVLAGAPVKDQKVQSSGPAPSGLALTWSLEKRSGRGDVKVLEQPSAQNGQTMKVRVDDTKGGSDRYVFRLNWKLN